MVHQPIATPDEKELIRISSLEQRIIEFENTVFKTANATLERRVAELENSLKEITQERDNLREIIATQWKNNSIHRFNSSKRFEFESVYGRVWKLVENMKSDCEMAINQKISPVSNLPKFPVKQNPISNSRPGTPKNQSSKISSPARSRASSVSNISVPSIPSRSNTPNGIRTPSVVSSSITSSKMQTPSRIQNFSPPDSYTSSRPNTPSNLSSSIINPTQNNSLSHLNSKMPLRSRTPIWPSCNNSSRPSTPNSSKTISNTPNTHISIAVTHSPLCEDIISNVPDDDPSIHSNIQSGLSSKSTGIPMYTPMTRKQAIV
ncbi:13890_t:CDS:2 [Dentiscutata erythropus]|uniref:13890_t:CDS:1 n=1 Tax=Dentiscutata erythropus TaxID=1348616 RepID=A0A9N9AJZ7_9GLOM|nr:13890_t:CDS:2 [Dentiscutata erythropus]